MQIVIFSDIHGNVVALEAVLADIRRTLAPDLLFVAGDLVQDGPRPAETLALLRSLDGARFVMGNTDSYLANGTHESEAAAFTSARLTSDDLQFLRDLPFEQRLLAAPGHELLVVHANPYDLEAHITPELSDGLLRHMLNGVSAEVVAFGHYHVPFLRKLDNWTLLDVSSVGLPRDGDQRAVYAVLTWDGQGWQAEHRRVPFDIEAVARDYVTVGFPEAQRAAARLLTARYAR